jgi:hypothetical protein
MSFGQSEPLKNRGKNDRHASLLVPRAGSSPGGYPVTVLRIDHLSRAKDPRRKLGVFCCQKSLGNQVE